MLQINLCNFKSNKLKFLIKKNKALQFPKVLNQILQSCAQKECNLKNCIKEIKINIFLKPFTTSLALNLFIDQFGFNFFLRTHLHLMVLQLGRRSTNFQVLLQIRDFILSFTASFQNIASGDVKVSFKFQGFSSKLKT